MELDRTSAVRLPAIADGETPELPQPLLDARAGIDATVNGDGSGDFTPLASRTIADPHLSEAGRKKRLGELAGGALDKLNRHSVALDLLQKNADETAAKAVRDGIAKYDPARLLAIQQRIANGGRDAIKAAHIAAIKGDPETAAALVMAPQSFGIAPQDSRVKDAMHATIMDSVDPALRPKLDNLNFGLARTRAAHEVAKAYVQRITGTQPDAKARMERPQ